MTLRIQRLDERDEVVFRLAGRIQADQIPELQGLLNSVPDHKLVLDLKEVKLVDLDVVRFLAQSEAEGTRLRNCSAFIREWISQERRGMQGRAVQHQQSSKVRK
jgi:anti-anti-sigma regulatory factor